MIISVITVSYNARDIIGKTVESVLSQDYPDVEYVIVDGGSSDGTQDIIEPYRSRLAHYVSERDGGIYFGMNKGIDAVTGDYAIFINAGDVFADDRVLSDVAAFIAWNPDSDVVFGDSEQIYGYGSYVVKPQPDQIDKKMSISHQATFVRTELLRSHKFDTRYRYAADFEQLSFFSLSGAKFRYFDRLIARVEMDDGATFRHYKDSTNEMFDIIQARKTDVSKERRSLLLRKSIVRVVKGILPSFIRTPFFKFLAKHYKAL